jgi:hypothetical protein
MDKLFYNHFPAPHFASVVKGTDLLIYTVVVSTSDLAKARLCSNFLKRNTAQ